MPTKMKIFLSAINDITCNEVLSKGVAMKWNLVSFNCPEFTSLCPKTGQPDFAKIIINYIPREKMVESKSLKLYLFSFRNHGDFHEDCVNMIKNDLVNLMRPKYLEVIGIFNARGGISIYPFASYADEEHKVLERQRMLKCFRNQ